MVLERRIKNRLFLLRLLNYKNLDDWFIQRIVYFIEKRGREEKITTFNYNFIKSYFGVYSKELDKDISELLKSELILKIEDKYKVTEKISIMVENNEFYFKSNNFFNLLNDVFENTMNDLTFTEQIAAEIGETILYIEEEGGEILM